MKEVKENGRKGGEKRGRYEEREWKMRWSCV